jgi:hypothetical protein
MCSLLAENRQTLNHVLVALRDADIDGISLSGMTLNIEEAFQMLDPEKSGSFTIAGGGSIVSNNTPQLLNGGREASAEHRVEEVNEPESNDASSSTGAGPVIQSPPADEAGGSSTAVVQSTAVAKATGSGSTPASRRPLVVNIFQNIRITRSPKPQNEVCIPLSGAKRWLFLTLGP